MTRTFSKIYGLSALRIGWMYSSQAIHDLIQRIRTPFNANSPAMAAATAAVKQTDYVTDIKQHNIKSLQYISGKLQQLGIEVVPSVTNFYLLNFKNVQGKTASEAGLFMQTKGIIPRPAGNNDDFLRITVGFENENQSVVDALTEYMNQ